MQGQKSGQAAKNMKTLKYDKILSFLIPYIEHETETESSLPSVDFPDNSQEMEEDDNASITSNSNSANAVEETPKTKSKPTYYNVNENEKSSSETSEAHSTPTHDLFQSYIENKYNTS